jgi:hypothetical protein
MSVKSENERTDRACPAGSPGATPETRCDAMRVLVLVGLVFFRASMMFDSRADRSYR